MSMTTASKVRTGDVIKTKRGAPVRVYSVEATDKTARVDRCPVLRFTTNPHGTTAVLVPANASVSVR